MHESLVAPEIAIGSSLFLDWSRPVFYHQCNLGDLKNAKLTEHCVAEVFRVQSPVVTDVRDVLVFSVPSVLIVMYLDSGIQIFMNNLWPSVECATASVCTSVRFLFSSAALAGNGSVRAAMQRLGCKCGQMSL